MLGLLFHRLTAIWRLAGRQLALAPLVMVLGLAAAALEGLGIGLAIPLLAIVTGASQVGGSSFTALLRNFAADLAPHTRIVVIAGVMFSLIVIKNVVSFANTALSSYVCGRAGHAIRSQLALRLLSVDYAFMRDEEPGRLLNILANESWRTTDFVNASLSLLVNACAAAILYGLLLALSWQLTLIITVALAFMLVVHGFLAKRLHSPSKLVSGENHRLMARMLDLDGVSRRIRARG